MTKGARVAVVRQSVLIAVSIGVALVGLSACTPSTTVVEVTRITSDTVALSSVNVTESQTVTNQISQVKTFDQCASASPLRATIQFSSSSGQASQREMVLSAGAGGQVGLSSVISAQLEGAIEQHFASSVTGGSEHEEEVVIEVPARSRQEYSIVWQESRREGTVQYVESGETKTVSYSYRIGLELNSSTVRDLPCNGQPGAGTVATIAVSEPTLEALVQEPPATEVEDAAAPGAVPVSSLQLPFEDNFDGGPRSEWKVFTGQPVVTNGRLTSGVNDWLTMQLGDSSFSGNFTVNYVADWCGGNSVMLTIGEAVRYRFSSFGYRMEVFRDNRWDELYYDNAVKCGSNMEFRVAGAEYVVLKNGEPSSSVIYGTPASGPITLALWGEATVDNFWITSP